MKAQDNKPTLQEDRKIIPQADDKLTLQEGGRMLSYAVDKLTLQETEQLCELYMDCKLSVLEESELQYLLSKVDYHSPLIDEVRDVMGVELAIGNKATVGAGAKKRWRWSKRVVYSGIAASIAIVFGIGLSLYHNSSSQQTSSAPYYLAYANGHRLSNEAAKVQIEAEMQSAEAFMKEMSELEAQEKQMMDNFYNL